MAYYKKRKHAQGPTKNEEKVQRAKYAQNQARNTLGSKFPVVKHMSLRLAFSDQRQNLIEEKVLSYGPNDPVAFSVACPGRCGKGTFNLSAKITELVNGQRAASEEVSKCAEPLYMGTQEVCGYELKYRVELEYAAEEADSQPDPQAP